MQKYIYLQKKKTKTKQKPIIVAHIVHRRGELLAPQIPPWYCFYTLTAYRRKENIRDLR